MKSLSFLLLALLLGGGLMYMTMGGARTVRGPRGAGAPPAAAVVDPPDAPQGPEVTRASAPKSEEIRREVAGGAPRTPQLVYEGVVIGEGSPLQGAEVFLTASPAPLADAKSDERGRFRLALPAHGEAMKLFVRARGFVGLERSLPAKPAGGTELLGNLRVVRGVFLSGRVVNQNGSGIANAEVRVEPLSPGRDLLSSRATTKADGTFEVPEAPGGAVNVYARAAGYGERSVSHVANQRTPILIELAPGLQLSVRLITPRGGPVPGAEVSLLTTGTSRVPARRATSDEDGRVHFDELSAEVWNLRVAHPDYRPTGKNQIRAGQPEESLQCIPWPALEGRILAPDGSPPPAETLVQAMPASAPGDRISALTGGRAVEPDGRFRIGGLRPGDWTVRVTAPGFAPTQSPTVRLGIEGDGWAGTIALDRGSELLLRMTCGGEPVSRAEAEVASREPTLAQLWALRDSEGVMGQRLHANSGQVRFGSLPAGSVWVMIFAEGSPPTVAGPFDVPVGQVLEQTVELERGGRLGGRTTNPDGGPNADVQLRLIDRRGRLGFPLTVASDEDGRYLTPWLPPGRFTVEAFSTAAPTRRSGAKEVDLEPGMVLELNLSL